MENTKENLTEKAREYLQNADLYNGAKTAKEALELKIGLYGEMSPKLMEDYALAGLACSLYAYRTAGNEQLGEERFITSDREFANSLYYYSMALDISRLVYGEKSKETARIYTNMGSVYRLMDDDWQEEEYYMEAISIYSLLAERLTEEMGEDCPALADIYESLSMLYKNLDCTKEMLMYIEKAEHIYGESEEHKHSHDCGCGHEHKEG